MDPNPPRAEILDTCMHSDPKYQKPIGGELSTALAEMNTKEIIDIGMMEKEFSDFDLVQEKPVEENIDERKVLPYETYVRLISVISEGERCTRRM